MYWGLALGGMCALEQKSSGRLLGRRTKVKEDNSYNFSEVCGDVSY